MSPPPNPLLGARRGLRVLLVEDSPADAELLLHEIRSVDQDVIALRVETADELRRALAREPWDIVLSDYTLPSFDAPAALAIVQDHNPDLPFIIVSGTVGEDVAVTALKMGADDFLVKGKLARLMPAIERELREADAHRERKHRQHALEHDLRQTQAQAAYALEAAGAGVWHLDLQARNVEWSEPISVMFGLPSAVVKGSLDVFRQRVHPDDWFEVESALAQSIEHGAPYRAQFRSVAEDGTVRWINVKGRVTKNAAGEPQSLLGIAMDVTDRRELEEQLRQAQKLESVGRLAGGIAHDFNNLLTAILGYSEMILEQIGPDKPISGDLEEIRTASNRAVALTRQLLAFSRKQTLHVAPVDLNDVVSEMRDMLQRLIGEQIDIVLRLTPDLPSILADRVQVEQILMNLLVNARDAMPSGGVITVETVSATPAVRLRITDTGTGMDEATQARIFEPFFTTKEVGKGTGLGLSTVYGVMHQLGGNIAVASRVGHGTTFTLWFPESKIHAQTSKPPRGSKSPMALAEHREMVLVVEDQSGVRQLVTRILKRHGYSVLEAGNAAEALVLFEKEKHRLDLLLTDVVMPQMGGPELAAQLLGLKPDLKVLFITGYAGEDLAHWTNMAQHQTVEKPFTASGLLQAVHDVLMGQTPIANG
jgi:two-component system cell cycle sensor histidine kinase/response regulator CckA